MNVNEILIAIEKKRVEISEFKTEIENAVWELDTLKRERDEWAACLYYLKKDKYTPKTAEEIDDFENAKAELNYFTQEAAETFHHLAGLRQALKYLKRDLADLKRQYRELATDDKHTKKTAQSAAHIGTADFADVYEYSA